jgi:hypothetical protein
MKSQSPVTKGMIFAGCSFTWGQGLYYYSNMSTLVEPPANHYKVEFIKDTHIEFMKSIRFPRLVANHFNTFELCQPWNGGASYSIHDWWQRCFMDKTDPEKHKGNHPSTPPTYNYEDVSHVFYQFTQWARAQSPVKLNSQYTMSHSDTMNNPLFTRWLIDNNLTLDQYIDQAKRKEIQEVKDFLKTFVDKGIKVYIMSWPLDILEYIEQDDWLRNKMIKFDYKGNSYPTMDHMMETTDEFREILNPELTIYRDIDEFEITPQDMHPSKKCHRVIADSIIKHLEREI